MASPGVGRLGSLGMGTSAELERYEQRFRRAGLPLFIEDFSPTHDIFTRATPLLVLVFLAEMIGATSLDWRWWQNLLAVADPVRHP
jgi:hypothetical protein